MIDLRHQTCQDLLRESVNTVHSNDKTVKWNTGTTPMENKGNLKNHDTIVGVNLLEKYDQNLVNEVSRFSSTIKIKHLRRNNSDV
jgi:hypothetical protein